MPSKTEINPAAFTRAQRDAVEILSWAMEHFGVADE